MYYYRQGAQGQRPSVRICGRGRARVGAHDLNLVLSRVTLTFDRHVAPVLQGQTHLAALPGKPARGGIGLGRAGKGVGGVGGVARGAGGVGGRVAVGGAAAGGAGGTFRRCFRSEIDGGDGKLFKCVLRVQESE